MSTKLSGSALAGLAVCVALGYAVGGGWIELNPRAGAAVTAGAPQMVAAQQAFSWPTPMVPAGSPWPAQPTATPQPGWGSDPWPPQSGVPAYQPHYQQPAAPGLLPPEVVRDARPMPPLAPPAPLPSDVAVETEQATAGAPAVRLVNYYQEGDAAAPTAETLQPNTAEWLARQRLLPVPAITEVTAVNITKTGEPAEKAPRYRVGGDEAWLTNRETFTVKGTIATSVARALRASSPKLKIVVVVGGHHKTVAQDKVEENGDWVCDVKLPTGATSGPLVLTARLVVTADIELALGGAGSDATFYAGMQSEPAPNQLISVHLEGPPNPHVDTTGALYEYGPHTIRVIFDRSYPLLPDHARAKANFVLKRKKPDGTWDDVGEPNSISFDEDSNTVQLGYQALDSGLYQLTVQADRGKDKQTGIVDRYYQRLGASTNNSFAGENFVLEFFKPIGGELPSVTRGIRGAGTGPFVEFPEFTKPRTVPPGFNPSDHVETRVVRLYYYRDAHRVAQIVNRDVRSHNRAAVDMRQQLADKARTVADQTTEDRRAQELRAIDEARKTREVEARLEQAQRSAAGTYDELQRLRLRLNQVQQALAGATSEEQRASLTQQQTELTGQITNMEQVAASARGNINTLQAQVDARRDAEVKANEEALRLAGKERLAREEQFRREVAAANEDPDTYAPGVPGSDDPVRQVSISVVGEGLIQLRGPRKGIDVVHTMINQLDAPVGQVRVTVHTVQINGEDGERMERVAVRIQDYIDHSRFLTVQSAEMLRKAVVKVASRKAVEAWGEGPAGSQAGRDQKYLHAFFGADFIDELRTMESEFLDTGNKLLSLHSMDTTSLSSAMFMLALAKNSTRQEILSEFEAMLIGELPAAEECYYQAGGIRKHGFCHRKFELMACNARFQSFRGFFDAELSGDDTMTPVQREFVRLAQIFKSRLITELELRQRIVERALIEERIGDYAKQLDDAFKDEQRAQGEVKKAREKVSQQRVEVSNAVSVLAARASAIENQLAKIQGSLNMARAMVIADAEAQDVIRSSETSGTPSDQQAEARSLPPPSESNQFHSFTIDTIDINSLLTEKVTAQSVADKLPPATWMRDGELMKMPVYILRGDKLEVNPEVIIQVQSAANNVRSLASDLKDIVRSGTTLDRANSIVGHLSDLDSGFARIRSGAEVETMFPRLTAQLGLALLELQALLKPMADEATEAARELAQIGRRLGEVNPPIVELLTAWEQLKTQLLPRLSEELKDKIEKHITAVDEGFEGLFNAQQALDVALEQAQDARRPLDHKKFLDMLIDDMQEKFIDLVEGTRAHTANIDNYIQRLATALEDDFNTQYYYPAFRQVRQASRYWNVSLGQIETTSILANNRSFAKVSPQATMEFDLPRRDILVQEAMKGAKAMVDDYGALLQDPSFLALTKLGSGLPTSSPVTGGGTFSPVRSVVPGLSTSTAEDIMGQPGPGSRELGAALESLIPDPAVYKFETGTGFEIRPVIQPDGQAVVFHFNYLYTTNVREPVRADEKHLGRVKQHFIDTDVQMGNYEMREVSRYQVALKASRTGQGVPLLQDIPAVGILFRPLPSAESSLQQNLILAQSVIYPTLFDLMGLRWAPSVADLDPLRLINSDFIVRGRHRQINNRVFDYSSSQVDDFMRMPPDQRRPDLYRTQETIPDRHPNGYLGPGLDRHDSDLQEGYDPATGRPTTGYYPAENPEGAIRRGGPTELYLQELEGGPWLDTSPHGGPNGDVPDEPTGPADHEGHGHDGATEPIPAPPPETPHGGHGHFRPAQPDAVVPAAFHRPPSSPQRPAPPPSPPVATNRPPAPQPAPPIADPPPSTSPLRRWWSNLINR